MKFLRDVLDRVEHQFEKGGKLEKLYPLYEARDTFLYTPGSVTSGNTHVRDGIDLKRTMITVAMALFPAILMCLYNTGKQANLAISGGTEAGGWRADLMTAIGLGFDPLNIVHNFLSRSSLVSSSLSSDSNCWWSVRGNLCFHQRS